VNPAAIRTVGEPGFARSDRLRAVPPHLLPPLATLGPGPDHSVGYPQQRIQMRCEQRVLQAVDALVRADRAVKDLTVEVECRLVTFSLSVAGAASRTIAVRQ
jgi:hypothetical protein